MRTAAILFGCLSILIQPADAQSPRQEAEDAAGAVGGATSTVKGGDAQLPDVVPGYQTDDPEHLTDHYENDGAALEGATYQGLANDDDGEGGEAASSILNSYTTRPGIDVTRTDEFLSQSRGTLGNPDYLAGDLFFTDQNPACEPTQQESTPLEIKSCDVFRAGEDATCGIGTEVDVLAEKTYACFKETETYRKRCTEELSVSCKQVVSNCKLEDGLITTPDGDLQLSYTNFRHRAHLPTQSAGGGCANYTRRMVVNISDLSKLATARLSRVNFHDALSVYVNGTFVWGGPYGNGSRQNLAGNWFWLYGKDQTPIYQVGIGDPAVTVPSDPLSTASQYLGTCAQSSNTVTTPGVNIKPLMVQGPNVIEFRNAISGIGGFTADFEILMSCCGEWEETWSRQCPY